jgi:hypothetical protein
MYEILKNNQNWKACISISEYLYFDIIGTEYTFLKNDILIFKEYNNTYALYIGNDEYININKIDFSQNFKVL